MLMSVLIIFIICWTPRVAQSFSIELMRWAGLDPSSFALDPAEMFNLRQGFRMFSYVNSIVNIFIYYVTSK